MADLIPPFKPRRTYGYLSIAVLAVVAIISLAAAWGAMLAVERTSRTAVDRALFLSGEDWAEVDVNGLQVILSGDAPSEAARFAALSAAGHEVDGARVIDQMVLPEAVAIEPPRFSVEMLRNEAGISLIGLIPAETDREALTQRMRAIDPIQPVADFLETAEHPTPAGWETAFDFMMYVAEMLPRSKISMDAEHVAVEAIAVSPDEKQEWEQAIRRERPAGLRLALDIRAPLDVISPYIVRFLSDEQGARFDACTAYTPADRNKIISAGITAGVKGAVDCTIGLGVPSPDWPDAVARGIRAVRDMGGGSLTFSDADITLIAPATTPQDTYDRVIGELEADLPDVFSLHGVLTEPETGPASPAGTPEFIATLDDAGAVQLRGRVASEQDRTIVETLARARFGTRKVYAPLRLDPALPASWAVRTLAGLEALDQLADGRVVVRPDVVTVAGSTGDKGASAEISRLLSEKLGEAEDFRVNVKYEEALDPIAAMPTPQECVADINAALARNKITFAPGSAEIERASASTVDRIAEILKTCPDVAMEIGGYTDSQGREEMNQALSQRRAEAVVSALLARRVLTTNLKAFGYGEDFPIADNDTDEGRESNRRIEFSLVGETRPRAEVENGDAPTIRPPARPNEDGDVGADEADAEAPAEEDTGAAETTNSDSDAAVAPEETTEPDPETPDATDQALNDGATDTGETDAGDDAAQTAAPGVELDGGALDNGTNLDVEAPDAEAVASTDAADATDVAGAAPASSTDTEDAMPTDDTAADDTGEDAPEQTAAPDPVMETAPPAAEPDAVAPAEANDLAAPDASVPEDGSADLLADTADATAPVESAAETGATPGETDAPDAKATEDVPGIPETAETVPDEATAEIDTTDVAPAEATADADATALPDVTAEDDAVVDDGTFEDVAGATDPAGDDEAPGSGAETLAADDTAPEATAPVDTVDTVDTVNDDTDATAIATDTDDAAGTDPADAPASDIPATRPRARPPLVVHPELAGIRPRPRPAVIPAAPSTE